MDIAGPGLHSERLRCYPAWRKVPLGSPEPTTAWVGFSWSLSHAVSALRIQRVRCCWRPGDLAWAKEKWCGGCRRSSFPRQTVFLANRAGALTNYQVALFRILWYDRKSLFFTKFLKYPTFWDTLVRPKLIIFQYVFGESHFLGYSGATEYHCFSLCFWSIPLSGIP